MCPSATLFLHLAMFLVFIWPNVLVAALSVYMDGCEGQISMRASDELVWILFLLNLAEVLLLGLLVYRWAVERGFAPDVLRELSRLDCPPAVRT